MAQSRFSRRLGFLVILAALSFSMVLPAFALFDQDDTARGDQSLPIAENFSLTTYRDVAVSGKRFPSPSTRMERHSSAGFGRACAISHTEG